MRFVIVVHGGAGLHGEDETPVKSALKRACNKASELLSRQGTALDAVEAAIRELEDDPSLNAGYGSNLTFDGGVECDASLMSGDGSFGAIGAIGGIKNPISAARVVLEKGRPAKVDALGRVPPMMLAGPGASLYFLDLSPDDINGIPEPLSRPEQVPPDILITSRARKEWEIWHERLALLHGPSPPAYRLSDTVGAIVLQENGDMAAGVSSGGLLLKYPGRVGEAAIYGAGCWANRDKASRDQPRGIACSVSGTGEQIMREGLARAIGEACHPAKCEDPIGGLTTLFEKLVESERRRDPAGGGQAQAGAVTLYLDEDAQGSTSARLMVAFTTPSMAVGTYTSEDQRPKAAIHRRHSQLSDSTGYLYLSSSLLATFPVNR